MTDKQSDSIDRRTDTQRDATTSIGRRVLRGAVRGVFGGLIATVLMTLYRYPVFRALPPTAEFWAKYVGDGDPESYFGTGLLLHFLYGGAAGGLFGAGVRLLDFRNERVRRLATIGLALVYGLGLSVFGTRVLFRYLLDEDLESDEAAIFHVGHAVFGLTLGTWMTSGERSGEVYE